jgi:hypothetical protein
MLKSVFMFRLKVLGHCILLLITKCKNHSNFNKIDINSESQKSNSFVRNIVMASWCH